MKPTRLLKDSHAKKIKTPFITNTLSKVLLLAVEGLTPSLLSRVATPALDRLASRGSLSRSSWLKKTSSSSRQTPVWSSIYDLGHSPGWCLSSPPRLCPPWQPLPPASTLRLVRISQRVHVMIVAGDWNIGHRGLARWTNPAAGRPRVLGSQQSHHALGIHTLRTSNKYDETIFGRILPIQQLEAELEQFDGLEPSLALGGGQTLWGRTICWSFENTTKQQQRVLKCIAQWCFLDALAYLRSHVQFFLYR